MMVKTGRIWNNGETKGLLYMHLDCSFTCSSCVHFFTWGVITILPLAPSSPTGCCTRNSQTKHSRVLVKPKNDPLALLLLQQRIAATFSKETNSGSQWSKLFPLLLPSNLWPFAMPLRGWAPVKWSYTFFKTRSFTFLFTFLQSAVEGLHRRLGYISKHNAHFFSWKAFSISGTHITWQQLQAMQCSLLVVALLSLSQALLYMLLQWRQSSQALQ